MTGKSIFLTAAKSSGAKQTVTDQKPRPRIPAKALTLALAAILLLAPPALRAYGDMLESGTAAPPELVNFRHPETAENPLFLGMTPTELLDALPAYGLLLEREEEEGPAVILETEPAAGAEVTGRLAALFEVDPATGNYGLSGIEIRDVDSTRSILGVPAAVNGIRLETAGAAAAYFIAKFSSQAGLNFDESFVSRLEQAVAQDQQDDEARDARECFLWSENQEAWVLIFNFGGSGRRGELDLVLMDLTKPFTRWTYEEELGLTPPGAEPPQGGDLELFQANLAGRYKPAPDAPLPPPDLILTPGDYFFESETSRDSWTFWEDGTGYFYGSTSGGPFEWRQKGDALRIRYTPETAAGETSEPRLTTITVTSPTTLDWNGKTLALTPDEDWEEEPEAEAFDPLTLGDYVDNQDDPTITWSFREDNRGYFVTPVSEGCFLWRQEGGTVTVESIPEAVDEETENPEPEVMTLTITSPTTLFEVDGGLSLALAAEEEEEFAGPCGFR